MSSLVSKRISDQTLSRSFTVIATAEAISWGALLITMYFKWVVAEDPHAGIEGGVPVSGAIHGALFLAYVGVTLLCWQRFRWSLTVTFAALVAALPPFCTYFFERWARRRELLG